MFRQVCKCCSCIFSGDRCLRYKVTCPVAYRGDETTVINADRKTLQCSTGEN